jgi:predicted Zn-dependent peptidase
VSRTFFLAAAIAAALSIPAARSAAQSPTPPAPAPLRAFQLPPITQAVLPNGVRIVVAERRTLPLVAAAVLVGAGTRDEPPAQAGLANLTAALLREGTRETGGPELARRMQAVGAQYAPLVNPAHAGFTLMALRADLPGAFRLAASTVVGPRLAAEDFARVRAEVSAARDSRRDDPVALAFDVFLAAAFPPGTPYAAPAEGTAESLRALTPADVEAWHRARYTPANTTVLFVGDIGLAEARRLVEESFGGWSAVAPPPVAGRVRPAMLRGPRIVLVDRAGSVQSAIVAGHPTVAPGDGDYLPLLVINRLFGVGVSSRLNASLRERHGWTYGMTSYVEARPAAGLFTIEGSVRTGVTDSAVAEIVREHRRLAAEPVPRDELSAAAEGLAGSFPASLLAAQALRTRLVNLLGWGLPLDFYAGYRERLTAITPAQARAAAGRLFDPASLVVVVVGDRARVEAPLRALGLGPVEVRGPADEGPRPH